MSAATLLSPQLLAVIGSLSIHNEHSAIAEALGKLQTSGPLLCGAVEFSTISPLIALSADENFQSFAKYLIKPVPALRVIEGGRQ